MEEIGYIKKRDISQELRESYLDYAMSVIVQRALPDARDGMKPVQRRILYAMHTIGLRANAKYRKSATVVGEVLGKYHPHGDMAVYDALVRMAQDFSLRYPLINGQGNFGSVDGDSAAAMRYTETKLTRIAEEMLADIDKETVAFVPNYDGVHQEPSVLPAKIPQLLMNGSWGIAVGMATTIPPHNLTELSDAIIALVDDPTMTSEEIMQIVKGPDFPTGGIIYDRQAIIQAYSTGKGPILARAKTEITENRKGMFQIVVTELPYQVNKAVLLEKIAELVKTKRVEGIKDARDESDKDGIRVAIDLKSDAQPQKVLNKLFKYTDLEKVFHLNMLALVENGLQPQILSIKGALEIYVTHRQEVVTRRTQYDLRKTLERLHILEGLSKALDHIEEVIQTIKKSQTKETAHANLRKQFKFSDAQATAILEMRLQTLAGLERKKIDDEMKEKRKLAEYLQGLLNDPRKILSVVKDETLEMKEKYGDARKTKVVSAQPGKLSDEDMVPEQDVLITLSHGGYIKQMPVEEYKSQKRGGKGISAMQSKSEDVVQKMIVASSHDNILFFTNRGKVFQIKAYELPQASRLGKGKAVVNFVQLDKDEIITAAISMGKKESFQYLVMITRNGTVKKVKADAFSDVRRSGLIAITLKDGDTLGWVSGTMGTDEVLIGTANGQSIRFSEHNLRPMGRNAAGVRALTLKKSDHVVGVEIVAPDMQNNILNVTENGYAKMSNLKEFRIQGRGGSGIRLSHVTDKTGKVVGIKLITDEQDLIAISQKGHIIRLQLKEVPSLGRNTQGVRIMRVAADDQVADISCI